MNRPKKWLGQHFLIDETVIHQIIRCFQAQSDQLVVEIGPGQGVLTQALADKIAHFYAVEIDRDLIPLLRQRFPSEVLTLFHQDVLTFEFPEVKPGTGWRIIGNLPYQISTPLLFHCLPFLSRIQDMHFMVQKEVAERIVAQPGTRTYGRLSVMIQYFCQVTRLFDIRPEAFHPPPKVMSSFIRILPKQAISHQVREFSAFQTVVFTAFNQRRKKIRSSLQDKISESQLIALGIDPNLRAEALSIEDFVAIANATSL